MKPLPPVPAVTAAPSLTGLPNDVLVDHILSELTIFDVLRLRRTNKFFNQLTRHAIVWTRLLRGAPAPLPPLPPDIRAPSAAQLERRAARAHALDAAWHAPRPALHAWTCNAWFAVEGLALLPGGHFLVASVADTEKNEWAVVVYAMDTAESVIVAPLSKTRTEGRAENLTARYADVGGVESVVVMYTTREWQDPGSVDSSIDINDLPADTDPPHPITYTCHALHTPLATLRNLHQSVPILNLYWKTVRGWLDGLPSALSPLTQLTSPRPLAHVALDAVPCAGHTALLLSAVQGPDTLLCTRADAPCGAFAVRFSEPGQAHFRALPLHRQPRGTGSAIKALRVIPPARALVLARHNGAVLNVEWHDLPPELLAARGALPAPRDTLVLPSRHVFRRPRTGPAAYRDVRIALEDTVTGEGAAGEGESLPVVHVYIHTSDTPSSATHAGIEVLSFTPQPPHMHLHSSASSSSHLSSRSFTVKPVPRAVPDGAALGLDAWAIAPGATVMTKAHYCVSGQRGRWWTVPREGEVWRVVQADGGRALVVAVKEGEESKLRGFLKLYDERGEEPTDAPDATHTPDAKQLTDAPDAKQTQDATNATDTKETKGAKRQWHSPLAVALPGRGARLGALAWDGGAGRMCWAVRGEAVVRVVDFVRW